MKYLGYTLLGLAAVLWLGPLALAIVDLSLWFVGVDYQIINWTEGRRAWTAFVTTVTIFMLLANGLS